MKISLLLAPILTVALATTALGVAVPVNNFSFEIDVLSDGGGSPSAPTGWTLSPPFMPPDPELAQGGAENPTNTSYSGTSGSPGLIPGGEGSQVLYLNSYANGVTAYMFQDVGLLLPDTLYTLTVAIGNRLDRVNDTGFFSLVNGVDIGGTILSQGSGFSSTAGAFEDFSINFTTGSSVSGDLTIVLSNQNPTGKIQASFDNVRLDATAVPEPTSVMALMTGLASLCGLGRFRRNV